VSAFEKTLEALHAEAKKFAKTVKPKKDKKKKQKSKSKKAAKKRPVKKTARRSAPIPVLPPTDPASI
jgi:hypothetical protein